MAALRASAAAGLIVATITSGPPPLRAAPGPAPRAELLHENTMQTKLRVQPFLIAVTLQLAAGVAWAQTTVADPWVRGTVAQQKATGLFVTLTSTAGGKLLSASSPVAGVVEIHEMAMQGTTMRMRALPDGLELPAGTPVELKPGGHHVMLLDLKRALAAGDTVPVTLVIEGRDGQRETLEIAAPVRALGGAMPMHKKH